MSELCKEANEVMSKAGSSVILKTLMNMEIDVDTLPMGPEEMSPAGIETVVLAKPVPARGRLLVDGVQVEVTDEGDVVSSEEAREWRRTANYIRTDNLSFSITACCAVLFLAIIGSRY